MANINSYYLYQKYEKRGDQPWIPLDVYSVDGDGTMPTVMKEEGDPYCNPIYRVNNIYSCVGHDRYVEKVQEISYDNGETWQETGVVTAATLDEKNSYSCGYMPQNPDGLGGIEYKFVALSYNYGRGIYVPNCCSSTTLTQDDTKEYIPWTGTNVTLRFYFANSSLNSTGTLRLNDFYSAYQYIYIGSCVDEIGDGAFQNPFQNRNRYDYVEKLIIPDTVIRIGNNALYATDSIIIGTGCTSIGEHNISLNNLVIKATTPPTYGGGIDADNVYVPARSIDLYKNHAVWGTYGDKLKPIYN